MGVPSGPWYIDDTLTFTIVTHRFDTGALTDADAVPAYRIYEDETGTAILTGNTAKLDDAGTTGFYSEQITLSAANGFEAGKSYAIYVSAAVNSVTGGQTFNFKVSGPHPANVTQFGGSNGTFSSGRPEVNASHISGSSTAADNAEVVFATDFSTNYDTTLDRWQVDVDTIGGQSVLAFAGTADSGTDTTMVDAARTEADDHWNDECYIVFDTGTNAGVGRRIRDWVLSTTTMTFDAFDNAVDTGDQYHIETMPLGSLGTPPTAAAIADAVWDEDATGHQTQGTFGQAIGDPAADTTTIYAAVVTGAAGTHIAADIIAVKAETASILTDTAEIGAAGAGLTNINLPNQTMDITGNITGNLSGSVGSVTGAVGSVTGAVGSVTGNVSGNVTGTIGGLTAAALKDFFDTDSTTTYASAVAGSVVKEIADNAAGAGAPTADEIADAVLDRDMSAGVDSGSTTVRTPRQALRFLRNKWDIAAGTLTVKKEDDSTTSWTATLTSDAAAEPVIGSNPAGP